LAFGDIPPASPTSEQPPRDRPHGVGEAGSHVPVVRLAQAVGPHSAPGCCGCMSGRWFFRRAPEPFPFWASLYRSRGAGAAVPFRLGVSLTARFLMRSRTGLAVRPASYGSLSMACWLAGEMSTWGVVVIPAFLPASRGAFAQGTPGVSPFARGSAVPSCTRGGRTWPAGERSRRAAPPTDDKLSSRSSPPSSPSLDGVTRRPPPI
jgi:hypothetical protein